MTKLTIQFRVRPGGPTYPFLPAKDTNWSRYQSVGANWAKRRLTQLRRTMAFRPANAGLPRHRLFEFRLKPGRTSSASPSQKHSLSASTGERDKG